MSGALVGGLSLRRLWALCRKESYQIWRDPSSILIAFIMPVLLLFVLGYAVNLDVDNLHVGLLREDNGAPAISLPMGHYAESNLPVGMMFSGHFGAADDAAALRGQLGQQLGLLGQQLLAKWGGLGLVHAGSPRGDRIPAWCACARRGGLTKVKGWRAVSLPG